MNKIISDTLKDLGITPGMHGYDYLRYAIKLTIDSPEIAYMLTKRIYPDVAKHFNSTPARVERAMRHSITIAWDEPYNCARDSIFRGTIRAAIGKPTNGAFIATVADYLITERKVSHDTAC